MQVQMADVLQVREPLRKIMSQPLPVNLSWQMCQLYKSLSEHFENFDNVHASLVAKYGAKIEDDVIEVADGKRDAFDDELRQLLQMIVDVNTKPVESKALAECRDNVYMTPSDMSCFIPFVL